VLNLDFKDKKMVTKEEFKRAYFQWCEEQWIQEIKRGFPLLNSYASWAGKFVAEEMSRLPLQEQIDLGLALVKRQLSQQKVPDDGFHAVLPSARVASLVSKVINMQMYLQEESNKFNAFDAERIATIIRETTTHLFNQPIKFLGSNTCWCVTQSIDDWQLVTCFEVNNTRNVVNYDHRVKYCEKTIRPGISIMSWFGIAATYYFIKNEDDIQRLQASLFKCIQHFINEFKVIIKKCANLG
jgi:hypothetical protein